MLTLPVWLPRRITGIKKDSIWSRFFYQSHLANAMDGGLQHQTSDCVHAAG
jgi:hypothetical protein